MGTRTTASLALSFVLLNILDMYLTNLALGHGGYELNPIMRHLIEYNAHMFSALKVYGSMAAVALLLLFRKHISVGRILIGLDIVMLGVVAFNLISLARMG